MKPCWCKTITNLLLCINFHSDNCLWSSPEGPAACFPAKQMRPLSHLFETEWGYGRERGCIQEPLGRLPWSQACLLEWADILFIRIIVTFRSNAGTFLFFFWKQANSKVVPSLYLGHTVVLLQQLWQIYHFFPINFVFSVFSLWHSLLLGHTDI